MTSYFKLPYWISNNGDGSASLRPTQTFKSAEEQDDAQVDDGWAEPSAGTLSLKVEDGILYYHSYEMVNGKYQLVWNPILEKE